MAEFRTDDSDAITGIIAEFSEVFAFSRARWTRYAEEIDAELSGVGLIVLQYVIRKGPVTATGISQVLEMDKSIVSRQLAKLRDLEFIETMEAPEDRRVQLITGSPKAARLVDHIRGKWASAYRERFEGWTDRELEALRTGLHRFNAAAIDTRPDSPAVRCARQASDTGVINTVSSPDTHTHEG